MATAKYNKKTTTVKGGAKKTNPSTDTSKKTVRCPYCGHPM